MFKGMMTRVRSYQFIIWMKTFVLTTLILTNISNIFSFAQSDIYTQENCNITLTGPNVVWKRVELIANPESYRLWPFTCHITFHAKGDGDQLVHLEFDDLTLGGSDKLCRRGYLSILDIENSSNGGTLNQDNQLFPASNSYSTSLSALDPGSGKDLDVAGKFCWLAHKQDKSPSPFYSEHNTVRLMVRGNAWFDNQGAAPTPTPIRFALRYRFVPRDRAYGRYGNLLNDAGGTAGPIGRGSELPGTYCDRIYVDCKDCRVRSPGWPGTYLRNLTCRYYILNKRNRGPNSHVVVKAGPGAREGMSSLDLPGPNWSKRGQGNNDGLVTSGRIGGGGLLFLNCLSDRIEIYDGSAPKPESLIGTFCGHGLLPSIVSTKPDVLVKFVSAPSGSLGLPGFELITHSITSSDAFGSSLMQVTENKDEFNCNFVIAGNNTKLRKGKFSSLQHWIRPNTTCNISFNGRPKDRVFIIFKKFYINPSTEDEDLPQSYLDALPIDEMYNDISVPNKATSNCKRSVTLRLGNKDDEEESTHLGSKLTFCTGSSPYICPASYNHGQAYERACEVGKESYLSLDNKATITYHEPWGSYDGTNIMFEGRYEFIDMSVPEESESVPGSLCDLLFRQNMDEHSKNTVEGNENNSMDWISISAPKNVMLYGVGGRNHLRCVYEFIAASGYVVEINVNKVQFGESAPRTSHSSSQISTNDQAIKQRDNYHVCNHMFNQSVAAFECMNHNPRRHLRIVSGDGREMGCFCTNEWSAEGMEGVLVRRFKTVRIEFSLHGLSPWEGPEIINFDVKFRYVEKRTCEDNLIRSIPERGIIQGSVEKVELESALIDNNFVESGEEEEIQDLSQKSETYGIGSAPVISRICSWRIKVDSKHHIFIKFERLNLDVDCSKEKILFYTSGSPKPYKVLCQRDHTDDRQVFSEGWNHNYNKASTNTVKNDVFIDTETKVTSTKLIKRNNVRRYNTIIVELIYTEKLYENEIIGSNVTMVEKFYATWLGIIKPSETHFITSEEIKYGNAGHSNQDRLQNDNKRLFKAHLGCPFQCPGSCISEDFVCDGIADCPGNYDLTNSPDERAELCETYVPKSRAMLSDGVTQNETYIKFSQLQKSENEQYNLSSNGTFNASTSNMTITSSSGQTRGSLYDKLKKIPVWLYTVLIIIILMLICSIIGFGIVIIINSQNRKRGKGNQGEKNGSYQNGHKVNGFKNQHKSFFSLWKMKSNNKQKYHQVNIVPAGSLIDEIDMPSVNSETNSHLTRQISEDNTKLNGNTEKISLTTQKLNNKDKSKSINHIKYRYFQFPKQNIKSKTNNMNTVKV